MSITEDTREFIVGIFGRIAASGGDYRHLLDALADDLVWTVTGTSPIAGEYRGKDDYVQRCFQALDARLAQWPNAQVVRVLADGPWAAVYFTGTGGLGTNGTVYDMDYSWWMHVHAGVIDQVIGFYDTQKVAALFA